MTVLKTESPALSVMNEKLWLEKACSNLIPELPLWIIEYAWSKRMMEVLIGGLSLCNNKNVQTCTRIHAFARNYTVISVVILSVP